MILAVRWCRLSMTLFHHLKLKRPRMNSVDHSPGMSQHAPPRKKVLGNGSSTAADKKSEITGGAESKDGGEKDDVAPADASSSSTEGLENTTNSEDTEAMPQLERQNSVFDGGGTQEGRDNLPHLSPQVWSPSLSAYPRPLSGGEEEEDAPPPPLLMGDVLGRGKTMVWTHSPSSRSRVPPSSTVTSPSPPKRPSSTTSSSPHFESAQALVVYRQAAPQSPFTSSSSRPVGSSFESTDEESSTSIQPWPSTPATDSSSSTTPQQISPDTQALNLSVASTSRETTKEEDGQSMVCMICEDRATGLHYGIITCEGCKGFFKRTVQNKRVYSCVADGNCEVTRAQRNRCQYCRFQKCVRQGMVLAAVREDRMPGGRNSGAVYNLYCTKVKYKKHRRNQKNGHLSQIEQQQQPAIMTTPTNPRLTSSGQQQQPQHQDWANGQILKAALTSPADVLHLRHRTENCVTSSSAAATLFSGRLERLESRMTPDQAAAMIRPLVECDVFEEVAKLRNVQEMLERRLELNEKLCHIGDNIVFKLVQWTKRLPFYHELPVAIHTQLLTHKWHELLVLTSCAFLAIRGSATQSVAQSVSKTLKSLREGLAIMVGEPVGLEELAEAGPLVERLARLSDTFRRMSLCMEEYVCLKIIIMQSDPQAVADEVNDQKELEAIHDRYMKALQVFVEHRFPTQTTRFSELLRCIPEVQATASLVVQGKMFYVPLFLNTSPRSET